MINAQTLKQKCQEANAWVFHHPKQKKCKDILMDVNSNNNN